MLFTGNYSLQIQFWHSKHLFLCQHTLRDRISSTSTTSFIWRHRGWTSKGLIGGKLGNLLRWKTTWLLPKHRDTVKLNFPLHILFVKKKNGRKKLLRQQYLKLRAAIKMAILCSIAARVAYSILQKNLEKIAAKLHLEQNSGIENLHSSFSFELCTCILKKLQTETGDCNKMAHLQEQLAKTITFYTIYRIVVCRFTKKQPKILRLKKTIKLTLNPSNTG